jgi:hypothetical protein
VLEKLCERTRYKGKVLKEKEISDKCRAIFGKAQIDLNNAMYEIGIPLQMPLKPKKPTHDWKLHSYRNTPEYKALSNRTHEENKQLKSEKKKNMKKNNNAVHK